MQQRPPIEDWATDYDIFDPAYVQDPTAVWRDLRERCPIAHTDRWLGSYLPTRYDDVQALAKMVPELSSRDPLVIAAPPLEPADPTVTNYGTNAPPISSDPPEHTWIRRLLLPHFSPRAVEVHRAYTERLCHELIDGFIGSGEADGAVDYAQQIPPRVIAHLLGIEESRVDEFVEWVRGVLEFGLFEPETRRKYRTIIRDFFREQVALRKEHPGDDLISALVLAEHDGEPIPDHTVVGICNLMLVAGIDTTWSSIGSALWHFGTHSDDRRRLAADPELFPTAIEEMLRAYAPVTMGREAIKRVTYNDVTFEPGAKILMNFPAANRDPAVFEDPDEVKIDRARNRHVAFGSGIHRCLGSNLARLEMDIALRTWLDRIPDFELADPEVVTWAGGQVRGPRALPVRFPV